MKRCFLLIIVCLMCIENVCALGKQVALSDTKLQLAVGEAKTLKISGVKKASAASSNKEVVEVVGDQNTFLVKGLKDGVAKIIVSANVNIYVCDVTVGTGTKNLGNFDIVISGAGDCTLGHDSKFNKRNRFDVVYKSVQDDAYFFKKVKSVFSQDDMTLVNFEGTLSTSTNRIKKAFNFKGPYKYINILKEGAIEAVAFANNHCRDYGEQSYKDTIRTFKNNDIAYSSYGTVGRYDVKGKTIGMIAVNGLEGLKPSQKFIKSGMAKLQDADYVIVSMHCGVEGSHKANKTQKALAHYAVDAGADLVIGHHPHVLQGVEKYKGVYIAYSLGNFCFGGNRNPKNKDTMIFQATCHFEKGKLQGTTVQVIPCSLSSVSNRNNYQPIILTGEKKMKVLKKINSYSKAFKIQFTKDGLVK